MRHLTCDPNIEIIGATVLGIVENLQSDEIQPLLGKHGLANVQPNEWYPAERWLSVMNDLADNPNTTQNYVAVGMSIAERVVLPPELQSATLPQILTAWDDIYQMQHRGGDIGHVRIEKLSETKYRTIHIHLYPDDLTYGIAYGWSRRFLPKGTHFTVMYEDINNRLDSGEGTETSILVEWE